MLHPVNLLIAVKVVNRHAAYMDSFTGTHQKTYDLWRVPAV